MCSFLNSPFIYVFSCLFVCTYTHTRTHASNMHNIRHDRIGHRKLVHIDFWNSACLNVPSHTPSLLSGALPSRRSSRARSLTKPADQTRTRETMAGHSHYNVSPSRNIGAVRRRSGTSPVDWARYLSALMQLTRRHEDDGCEHFWRDSEGVFSGVHPVATISYHLAESSSQHVSSALRMLAAGTRLSTLPRNDASKS